MADSMGKGWKPKFLLHGLSEEEKEETISNVAWRMINIYRQLHIFTKEDIERYNAMLLKTDLELQMLIADYPGGGEVSRYLSYLKGGDGKIESNALDAKEIAEEKAKARILADALAEKDALATEKIVKVQLDSAAGGGGGDGGARDAFVKALPPVPAATAQTLNIDNVSFDEGSMEKMVEALINAQIQSNEKNAQTLATAISQGITESQATSANVIAEALSKMSLNHTITAEAPIDVSYSPVVPSVPVPVAMAPVQSEGFDANALANFASDISEKIAISISSAIASSQESNTKALAEIVNNISFENKGFSSEDIAKAITEGLKGVNLGSVKMEVDKPLRMEMDGPVKMEGSTNLEVSGATINANGGGMTEDMMHSFAQAFANAQLEVSQAQTSNLAEAFSKAFTDAQVQVSQSQNASLAEAFSKSFSEAQIQVSQVQTDNLAGAFAKAVTLSQTEMSSSLQAIVAEIVSSQHEKGSSISAQEISDIVTNAIDKLSSSGGAQSPYAVSTKLEVSDTIDGVIAKLMDSFTKTQIEMSKVQNENIEKVLEVAARTLPAAKVAMDNTLAIEDKSSETYNETWLGDEYNSSEIGGDGINSDMFEGDFANNMDEVSLKEAMTSDPYNLLLKQKKVFKDHKVLYDSDVGLHIAYGDKTKNKIDDKEDVDG